MVVPIKKNIIHRCMYKFRNCFENIILILFYVIKKRQFFYFFIFLQLFLKLILRFHYFKQQYYILFYTLKQNIFRSTLKHINLNSLVI